MKAAPLLLLSLALVGCVTVQPCVCPTAPAPQTKPDTGIILTPNPETANLLPMWTTEYLPGIRTFAPGSIFFVSTPTPTPTPTASPDFETSCTITEPSGKTYPCESFVSTPTPSARERRER